MDALLVSQACMTPEDLCRLALLQFNLGLNHCLATEAAAECEVQGHSSRQSSILPLSVDITYCCFLPGVCIKADGFILVTDWMFQWEYVSVCPHIESKVSVSADRDSTIEISQNRCPNFRGVDIVLRQLSFPSSEEDKWGEYNTEVYFHRQWAVACYCCC